MRHPDAVLNTCEDLTELITDFLEDRLGIVDRVLFRAHVATCPSCRAYLGQMRATVDQLDRLEPTPMPEDVQAELLERFRGWKRG